MIIKKRVFFLLILSVLFLVLLSACAKEAQEYGFYPGNKAYDITLENTSGEMVSLSDYEGKALMLFFWTSE
ncbi:MAG: redoxin domain-containing protein [Clostridiales bacterium]|nr:redoxin domain-containing protein [Clostridiales bacterium]